MGPIWRRRVGGGDPTGPVGPVPSGLTSPNDATRAARPFHTWKVIDPCFLSSDRVARGGPAGYIRPRRQPLCRIADLRSRVRHLARPWRAYRAMGKVVPGVWWPRIWTRNAVEPMRIMGTGRDSLVRLNID